MPIQAPVIYFLRRGADTISCETRLNTEGPGFELIVTRNGESHTERFLSIAPLLQREHELMRAWLAQGWSEVRVPSEARSREPNYR